MERSAVNSRGEIVAVHDNSVSIISRTGKPKSFSPLPVLLSQDEDGNEMKPYIGGVAVDEENNVYLIVFYYKENQHGKLQTDHVVLYVFDEHCNHVKQKSELNFLPNLGYWFVPLAVNKNKDIVTRRGNDVHVCDVTGQLKYKFKPKCLPSFIGVSVNNEIIIASSRANTVEIYTQEGNLKTTIKLPAGHWVRGVAFHCGINKIIVLSIHTQEKLNYLHCYSETGEHQTSICLNYITCHDCFPYFSNIKSHPSGAAAVLTRNTILYL